MAVTWLLVSGVLLAATVAGLAAAQDDDTLEATLAALQTEVAAVESAIAERDRSEGESGLLDVAETIDAGPSAGDETGGKPETYFSFDGPAVVADGLELLYYDVLGRERPCVANCHFTGFIFGEMRNATDRRLPTVDLTFQLLDDDGNILGAVTAYPTMAISVPGQAVPFEGTFEADGPGPEQAASLAVQEPSGWGLEYGLEIWDQRVLQIQDVEEQARSDETLLLEGKVYNGGDVEVRSPQIVVAIYSAEGRFRGKMISLDLHDVTVPPGKTARFTVRSSYQGFENLLYAGPGYDYEIFAQ